MKKIAQIIPIKKLPRGMRFFDYWEKEGERGRKKAKEDGDIEIKVGDIVNIPFRKNMMIKGIVHSFKDTTDFPEAKEIDSLDEDYGGLLPYQLELIFWFSEYYYHSLGSTADMFFPAVPKRAVKISDAEDEKIPTLNDQKSDSKVISLSEQINSSKEKKYLLFPYDLEMKEQFYLELCRQAIKNKKQILILFPQVYKVEEFAQKLPNELKEKTAVLTSDLYTAKSRYFRTWKQIKENQKQIIIGTRSAIFAPLSQLELIVVDDSHSDDYKQWDQNPRYEVVNMAQKIQELTKCKLMLSSLTPRIEDAYLAKEQKYQMISLGSKLKNKIKVVDLREERKKRFTYLSETLINQLTNPPYAEASGGRQPINQTTLLIVNKKGEYSYFFCDDCKFEASCPSCGLPQVVDGSKLKCNRCETQQDIFTNCPKCRGTNLKKLGIGIEQIKNEINTLFPNNKNIIVSTGQGLTKDNFENLGLLGFVYIDSLAYLADFNSNYKLYSFQQELIQRSRSAKVISQTCFPDNLAFESLNLGYEYFYKKEIENRKAFAYPPFSTLIKLFFQHHDLAVCKKEAFDLYGKLNKKIVQCEGKMTEPYLHYIQKVRKRYRYQIAIFLPTMKLESENELLREIPDYWTIDKSPVNLL
ncbi:hypothetical protein HQ571_01495 [Candidatus Kuenenbacteria bacterium]|nr:hypothetical protein [Candidatus Kuenenbacteria bacterium]